MYFVNSCIALFSVIETLNHFHSNISSLINWGTHKLRQFQGRNYCKTESMRLIWKSSETLYYLIISLVSLHKSNIGYIEVVIIWRPPMKLIKQILKRFASRSFLCTKTITIKPIFQWCIINWILMSKFLCLSSRLSERWVEMALRCIKLTHFSDIVISVSFLPFYQ